MPKLADLSANAEYDTLQKNLRIVQNQAATPYERPIPANRAAHSPTVSARTPWQLRLPDGFTPSLYQANIFDALLAPYEGRSDDRSDLLIEAVAGSGKTKTLEVAAGLLPTDIQRRTLMTAFNAHIATELKQRQAEGRIPPGVEISTIHSYGFKALLTTFKPADSKKWVNGRKYKILSELAWSETPIPPPPSNVEADAFRAKWANCRKALEQLVSLAMLNLTPEGPPYLRSLMEHHGIEILPEAQEEVFACVRRVLQWGREGLPLPDADGYTYHPREMISYDDMVYLPIVLHLDVPLYRLILVDEAQDLNAAQRTLMLRAKGADGRAAWVGDRCQSIYGFAGADANSFERIETDARARRLPLSICYRCAASVVAEAQRIVPQIEARPDAVPGAVTRKNQQAWMEKALAIWTAQPQHRAGWLLLCRTNAPLVGWAFRLLREGVPVTMAGKDILGALKTTIRDIRNAGVKAGIVNDDMYLQFNLSVPIYRKKEGLRLSREYQDADALDAAIAQLYDRIDCAIAVAEAAEEAGITDWSAALSYVERIFEEHDGDVITLSSIHKAKGLESRNVALLHSELLPHPMVRQAWALEQERNLRYIAYTRAMERLYILSGKEEQ